MKNKDKLSEAQNELVKREEFITNVTAQSLANLREAYVSAQNRADKANATAGQRGAWWVSCLMVRREITLDEAFTVAKGELKESGIPVSRLELYRPLVPHAYHVRVSQVSDAFEERDDEMPKVKWYSVQQYRDMLTVSGLSAGDAVGRWAEVMDSVNEDAVEPYLIKLSAKGFNPDKATNEDKLEAVKTMANKLRAKKKSGKSGSSSQTPEQIALEIVSKDETCLSFLNICGNEILSRVLRVARQVLDSRINAAKRS